MMGPGSRFLAASVAIALAAAVPTTASAEAVGFESEQWVMRGGQVIEHEGRQCLTGFAYLDGVDISSGVVDVDVIATGRTSYPGIAFRVAGEGDYEWIYVRPHRANQYPDAVQYAPSFNGTSSWQLCNGPGYTAPVELPENEWVHLRLEFAGTQARLFVGESDEPALHVTDLARGEGGGSIGLRCPSDGTAYFADFNYREDGDVAFEPMPPIDTPPGTIANWEVSQSFSMSDVDLELPPDEQDVGEIAWTAAEGDARGLVDIARYTGRSGNLPDCVFARSVIDTDEARRVRLEFGYSDAVSLFLNDNLLFTASNAYRQRDPTSLGIIGFHDAVYLNLTEGENELSLIVKESFGGWGFMARDGNASFEAEWVEQVFETTGFLTPEAVAYDPLHDVFYVSNLDVYRSSQDAGGQFLAKLSPEGEVLDDEWVGGLAMPTGIAVSGGTLYVVDRQGLVEVDTETGEVLARHEIQGAAFLNDVAVDAAGVVYVSDSRGNAIHKMVDGEFSPWLTGSDVSRPNALLAVGGALLIGNGGDSRLISADLETGDVTTVARFREGNIDGIAVRPDGSYLVSHWEGRVYRVTPDGATERILDTTVSGGNAADFGYDPARNLLLVPTYLDNRVVGYRLGG